VALVGDSNRPPEQKSTVPGEGVQQKVFEQWLKDQLYDLRGQAPPGEAGRQIYPGEHAPTFQPEMNHWYPNVYTQNIGRQLRGEESRAEGGPVKPQSLYNVATAPPDIIAGAGALGEQNPSIQAMMRMHRERQRAMPRARGGTVDQTEIVSDPARQALMHEQRQHGPTGRDIGETAIEQEKLLNPAWKPRFNYARGGHADGGPYIVGEKGPELFVPDKKGTIIPHHEIRKLAKKYGDDGHTGKALRGEKT